MVRLVRRSLEAAVPEFVDLVRGREWRVTGLVQVLRVQVASQDHNPGWVDLHLDLGLRRQDAVVDVFVQVLEKKLGYGFTTLGRETTDLPLLCNQKGTAGPVP